MDVLWFINGPKLLSNSKGRSNLIAKFSRNSRNLYVIIIEAGKRRVYDPLTQERMAEIQSSSLSAKIKLYLFFYYHWRRLESKKTQCQVLLGKHQHYCRIFGPLIIFFDMNTYLHSESQYMVKNMDRASLNLFATLQSLGMASLSF